MSVCSNTPVNRESIISFTIECLEYSELVYENETIPARIPGALPVVQRVDKCSFKVVQLIVGGTAAAAKEFPHMARLGYGNSNIVQWECGGTIISNRFILTAGHCVETE